MLRCDSITKSYHSSHGETVALRPLSLNLEKGEFVAIQGPSGCGKTTLLMMCGTLLSPTAGSVVIDGENPYELSPRKRCAFRKFHIGFVFQRFHLAPYLNLEENVALAAFDAPKRDREIRAGELLERFGLLERRSHKPSELSAGEQQRAALARALLVKPKIILADEPTGNLDPDNAGIVLDALRECRDSGETILMATHNSAAATRADRVVRL